MGGLKGGIGNIVCAGSDGEIIGRFGGVALEGGEKLCIDDTGENGLDGEASTRESSTAVLAKDWTCCVPDAR